MTEENVKVQKSFNDTWGKKVVSDYLISKGIDNDLIEITQDRFNPVDMIVPYKGTINLIEIKNRHTYPKKYVNLKYFGLCDSKIEGLMKEKEKLEATGNKVNLIYIVLTESNMCYFNLNKINLDEMEVQMREVQYQTGSTKKAFHRFYQLPIRIAKINPIKQEHIIERNTFYESRTWN
jgi:hypothetical protein